MTDITLAAMYLLMSSDVYIFFLHVFTVLMISSSSTFLRIFFNPTTKIIYKNIFFRICVLLRKPRTNITKKKFIYLSYLFC